MTILHKFQNHNWENGFFTENSILKNNSYQPEVLFIGTFNHGWYRNPSDFFYGRGMYMWPIMANLFIHNNNQNDTVRNINNDIPSLSEIFEICKKGKISFADIVKGTKTGLDISDQGGVVKVNNYLWADYKDSHINYLADQNWIDDNVKEIIKYINETPSLKYVYFTFKTGGNWILRKKALVEAGINIPFGSVFTPTGSGFRHNLPIPFETRIKSLTHCWIWNGVQNDVYVNKEDYINLNHQWLIENGVNPNNF